MHMHKTGCFWGGRKGRWDWGLARDMSQPNTRQYRAALGVLGNGSEPQFPVHHEVTKCVLTVCLGLCVLGFRVSGPSLQLCLWT